MQTLITLDLSNNEIGNEGAEYMYYAFKENKVSHKHFLLIQNTFNYSYFLT